RRRRNLPDGGDIHRRVPEPILPRPAANQRLNRHTRTGQVHSTEERNRLVSSLGHQLKRHTTCSSSTAPRWSQKDVPERLSDLSRCLRATITTLSSDALCKEIRALADGSIHNPSFASSTVHNGLAPAYKEAPKGKAFNSAAVMLNTMT